MLKLLLNYPPSFLSRHLERLVRSLCLFTFSHTNCSSRLHPGGNPLCEAKKWRDKLIIMSKSLITINKKEVTESTRLFVQSWYAKKEERRRSKQQFNNSSSNAMKPSKIQGLHERNSDGYMLPQQPSSLGQFVTAVHNGMDPGTQMFAGGQPGGGQIYSGGQPGYIPTAVERENAPPRETREQIAHHHQHTGSSTGLKGGKTLPPIGRVASENRLCLGPP